MDEKKNVEEIFFIDVWYKYMLYKLKESSKNCHSERSEESPNVNNEMFRSAQYDNYRIYLKKIGISAPIAIILLLITLTFWFQNRAVPFYADDYAWINVLSHDSFASDVVSWWSNLNFNPTSCGRLTCHIAVQFLLEFGESFFDFANTLLFLSVLLLTALFCFSKQHLTSYLPWLLILLSFLYFVPQSKTLFFWGSGSANYLLTTVLVLIFFFLFEQSRNYKIVATLFVSLYAFCVGWSHEIFSLPIACALFVMFVLYWRHYSVQQYVIGFAFICGSVILFLSPGSLNRFLGQEDGCGDLSQLIFQHLITAFKIYRDGVWFYVVVALILVCLCVNRSLLVSVLKENLFFFLCWGASVCMMVILGHGGRALWGVELFSFVLVCRILDLYIDKFSLLVDKVAMLLCCIIVIHRVLLIPAYFESWNTYREAEILAMNANKGETIPIDDWHSELAFIDAFVEHPYELMMRDIWVRIPHSKSFCRTELYNKLSSEKLPSGMFVSDADNYVALETEQLKNAMHKGKLKYKLRPISFQNDDAFIVKCWHIILQNLLPSRYPTEVCVSDADVMHLNIKGEKYMLFKRPFCPILRDVETIIVE